MDMEDWEHSVLSGVQRGITITEISTEAPQHTPTLTSVPSPAVPAPLNPSCSISPFTLYVTLVLQSFHKKSSLTPITVFLTSLCTPIQRLASEDAKLVFPYERTCTVCPSGLGYLTQNYYFHLHQLTSDLILKANCLLF